ncbi:NfeD family protein [Zavarzinella formosa]|uniref:NfeD family protein n=1 Tax=Zavarzinella formosa TaxID=360055 RepID=UPI0002FA8999|nr:NfeD family protein [Zavarzinella formosa]
MDFQASGYLLIILGIVFILAELVLFTGGILAGIGAMISLVGVALLFAFGSTETGLTALLSLCIGAPLFGALIFYVWPYSPMSRKLIKSVEDDVTVANISGNLELEQLRGRIGRVVSPLRPSGIADFDGQRVDVITQGMMVETGAFVRCIDVRAGRVVVRPTEKPSANDLETADFS